VVDLFAMWNHEVGLVGWALTMCVEECLQTPRICEYDPFVEQTNFNSIFHYSRIGKND
jgi:hypothetical protein